MAFAKKTDYCGLSKLSTSIVVRDDALNGSVEKYQPMGQDGSFDQGTEVFGEDTAPSNSYALKAPGVEFKDGDIKLNEVTEVDEKSYALESFEIETAAGSAVKMTAKSKEIESDTDATVQCKYPIPAFKISTKQRAQILFAAFTLSGKGCTLTACKASIGGSINVDKVAGVKISSDINSGIITVTGTILRSANVAESESPVITPAEGWILTNPPAPTENNPETEYPTYEFELQLPLAKEDGE
jgi:hypothetical protein